MVTLSSVSGIVRHELREMLPPVIFFGLGFNAIALTLQIMSDAGSQAISHLTASIGALVVAKGILIADLSPFLNRFRDRARNFDVLWKSGLYYISASLLHFIERLVDDARAGGEFASNLGQSMRAFNWVHFEVVQMWLAILILSYTALMVMVRDLGHESFLEAFLYNKPGSAN